MEDTIVKEVTVRLTLAKVDDGQYKERIVTLDTILEAEKLEDGEEFVFDFETDGVVEGEEEELKGFRVYFNDIQISSKRFLFDPIPLSKDQTVKITHTFTYV